MPKRRRGGTPAAPRHNAPAKAAADTPLETEAVAVSDNGQRRQRRKSRTASTAVKRGKKRADGEDASTIDQGIPDASASAAANVRSKIISSPLHASGQNQQQQQSQHDNNLQTTLQRLDDEYAALDAMDAILRRDLRRLQRDEQRIRRALQLSSETLAQRREREARERDRAALERLESALMGKEEEEEDGDSDGGHGNGHEGHSVMAAVDDERKLSASEAHKGRGDEDQDDHAADMLSVSDLPAFI